MLLHLKKIVKKRFSILEIGLSSFLLDSVEFRQAQLNLLNSEQAQSKAKYDAKNAEFQVLAFMGSLVE